jgi:chromosomal replication initiator protein
MLMEKSWRTAVAFPRQVAMYLANLLIPQLSLKEIAVFFNRKDHTTVIHAKRLIETQFREDRNLRSQIEMLISNIRS